MPQSGPVICSNHSSFPQPHKRLFGRRNRCPLPPPANPQVPTSICRPRCRLQPIVSVGIISPWGVDRVEGTTSRRNKLPLPSPHLGGAPTGANKEHMAEVSRRSSDPASIGVGVDTSRLPWWQRDLPMQKVYGGFRLD